ncbi:hypothetical protein HDV01_005718 [Terramyces sp. JEL0728]|nr:hypothetical protein HDV01_005718 [Terramyces sp. JEL0728]
MDSLFKNPNNQNSMAKAFASFNSRHIKSNEQMNQNGSRHFKNITKNTEFIEITDSKFKAPISNSKEHEPKEELARFTDPGRLNISSPDTLVIGSIPKKHTRDSLNNAPESTPPTPNTLNPVSFGFGFSNTSSRGFHTPKPDSLNIQEYLKVHLSKRDEWMGHEDQFFDQLLENELVNKEQLKKLKSQLLLAQKQLGDTKQKLVQADKELKLQANYKKDYADQISILEKSKSNALASINSLKEKILSLQQDQSKALSIAKENEILYKDLKEQENKYLNLQEQLQASQNKVLELSTLKATLESNLSAAESTLKGLAVKHKGLETEIVQLNQQLNESKSLATNQTRDVEHEKERYANLLERWSQDQISNTSQLDEKNNVIKLLENETNTKRDEIVKMNKRIDALITSNQDTCKEFQRSSDKLTLDWQSKGKELAAFQSKYDDLERIYNATKIKVPILNGSLQQQEQEMKKLQSEYDQLLLVISTLECEKQQKETQIHESDRQLSFLSQQ